MTPFEEAGYTNETRFKITVVDSIAEEEGFFLGDIVRLLRDDGSCSPLMCCVKDSSKCYCMTLPDLNEAELEVIEGSGDTPDRSSVVPEITRTDSPLSLAKMVLSQSEVYNDHGQMQISEAALPDLLTLCDELSNECGVVNDIFEVRLCRGVGNKVEANIHQLGGGVDGLKDKMWLVVDNVKGVY